MNKTIDLIQKARDKQDLDVFFDLDVNGEKIPVLLSTIDYFDIIEAQDVEYNKCFAKYRREGLDQEPIDEGKWQKELKQYKDKEIRDARAKEKPQNMAEQSAQRFSQMKTMTEIIPRYMRDPKTRKLLFQTPDEQAYMKELIRSDMNIFTQVSKRYGELFTKMKEKKDEVKNSLKQES